MKLFLDSHRLLAKFATIALMLSVTSPALAEVYSWKDSKGQVHFSDRPDPTEAHKTRKLVVSQPNLMQGFRAQYPDNTAEAVRPNPNNSPTGPSLATAPTAPSSRGTAAQQQDSCKAEWAAYRASVRCFEGCGEHKGRVFNVSACGHCVEKARPSCPDVVYIN